MPNRVPCLCVRSCHPGPRHRPRNPEDTAPVAHRHGPGPGGMQRSAPHARSGSSPTSGHRPGLGHFPEHPDIDPCVDRRCLRGLMAQQGADDFQRSAVAQQIRRHGVPEEMPCRQSLRVDAGPPDRSLRDRRHSAAGQRSMKRRHQAQEHLLRYPPQAGHGGYSP